MFCITIIATIQKMRKKLSKNKSAVLCFFCIIVMREDIKNAILYPIHREFHFQTFSHVVLLATAINPSKSGWNLANWIAKLYTCISFSTF